MAEATKLDEARGDLFDAARLYVAAKGDDLPFRAKRLCEAASAYSRERALSAMATGGEVPVMPFGRNKGQLLKDCTTKDLAFVQKVTVESIANPEKSNWLESNQKLLKAIELELACR